MPVFKQYTESSYKWGIWKTSESLEELLALLPHKEKYEEGIGKAVTTNSMSGQSLKTNSSKFEKSVSPPYGIRRRRTHLVRQA